MQQAVPCHCPESRRSTDFGAVSTRVSDLRGYGGQLTLGVAPDVFKFRARFSFYTSLDTRCSGAGDSIADSTERRLAIRAQKEWAPNSGRCSTRDRTDRRLQCAEDRNCHAVCAHAAGTSVHASCARRCERRRKGRRSCFIPNPSTVADAALGNGLKSLLSTGSASARSCILANLGVVAGRNGCRGPWSESLNIQWRPPTPSRWGGRVVPNVYLQNVLAGVDQAIHGSSGLRGWGSQIAPDPVLLIPRGFDVASRSFKYDVNPRFADTRPGRSIARDPFRIVVDFSINLSTNFPLQQLRRAVEPVKTATGWEKRSADSLASFYLQSTSSVHKFLLDQTDSLFPQ